jgi:hypothetical protein
MKPSRLVLGLFDASKGACDRALARRLRDLTLSWARFGYQGAVIDGRDPGVILERAVARGAEYCLLIAFGTIFDENWYPPHWGRRDVHQSLASLMDDGDFLAAGRPPAAAAEPADVDPRCLLVNVARYAASGRPTLAGARLVPRGAGGPAAASAGPAPAEWLFQQVPPECSATFRAFDAATAQAVLHLVPANGDPAQIAGYLGHGIDRLPDHAEPGSNGLTSPQRRFLAKLARQVDGAKRGVFPWNLESYADVDVPPPDVAPPLSTVFGVAAGFKPYRILDTHGFDARTRVVFFDYSPHALEFRRRLVADWDGADYPRFLRAAFRAMPADTFFQLWADCSPADVAAADLAEVWRGETDRWGGERAFREHWNRCRSLRHEFLCCDLVEDPQPLLARLRPERAAVIWWSNAFSTIHSNWFLTIDERRRRYLRWIEGLAARAPSLLLYGADHVNSSVNSIRADQYAARLADISGDELNPGRFHRLQIRS